MNRKNTASTRAWAVVDKKNNVIDARTLSVSRYDSLKKWLLIARNYKVLDAVDTIEDLDRWFTTETRNNTSMACILCDVTCVTFDINTLSEKET